MDLIIMPPVKSVCIPVANPLRTAQVMCLEFVACSEGLSTLIKNQYADAPIIPRSFSNLSTYGRIRA